MATTSNPFGGLFTNKTVQEIERSLRAHRGALEDKDHLLHRHSRERSNHHAHREKVARVGANQEEDGNKNRRNGRGIRVVHPLFTLYTVAAVKQI